MMQFTEEKRKALIDFAESVLANYESGSYMQGTKSETLIRIALAALEAKEEPCEDCGGSGIAEEPSDDGLGCGCCGCSGTGKSGLYKAPPVDVPAAPDYSECHLCDSNYIAGMQAGFRFGDAGDSAGFVAAVERYRKQMRVGREPKS